MSFKWRSLSVRVAFGNGTTSQASPDILVLFPVGGWGVPSAGATLGSETTRFDSLHKDFSSSRSLFRVDDRLDPTKTSFAHHQTKVLSGYCRDRPSLSEVSSTGCGATIIFLRSSVTVETSDPAKVTNQRIPCHTEEKKPPQGTNERHRDPSVAGKVFGKRRGRRTAHSVRTCHCQPTTPQIMTGASVTVRWARHK